LAVSVWRLVKTLRMILCASSWPMHGVIVSFCLAHFTASLRISNGELHLFDGV